MKNRKIYVSVNWDSLIWRLSEGELDDLDQNETRNRYKNEISSYIETNFPDCDFEFDWNSNKFHLLLIGWDDLDEYQDDYDKISENLEKIDRMGNFWVNFC